MNLEIGTEAAQFPEKEYIHGIFVAVHIRQDMFPAYLICTNCPLNMILRLGRSLKMLISYKITCPINKIGNKWSITCWHRIVVPARQPM